MQALVYNLNLRVQKAFIEADIRYVDLLLHGGKGRVLGHDFSIIGLDGTQRLLAHLPASPERSQIADFVHDARLALALTDNAIRATATPVVLDEETGRGRTSALSAQVQAYGLAITISFLGVLLAAGALAAERDENTIGRLVARADRARAAGRREDLAGGRRSRSGSGCAILLGFGIAVEAGNVTGGEPWQRLPLVARRHRARRRGGRRGRRAHRRARARVADGLARRDPRRPAGGLPRARPARDRPRRRLDQRRVPVRARRALLRLRAVRRFAVGNGRARGGVARRAWPPCTARSPGSRRDASPIVGTTLPA